MQVQVVDFTENWKKRLQIFLDILWNIFIRNSLWKCHYASLCVILVLELIGSMFHSWHLS